jgi:hypothetical protein
MRKKLTNQTCEPETINLLEFLGEGLIRTLEDRPIEVEFRFADGSCTFEISQKHPWYKELKRRRDQQIEVLRVSLRAKPAVEEITQKERGAAQLSR